MPKLDSAAVAAILAARTFTPTAEQTAIVEAARTSKDNLLIQALAGAAKTSTLELIAKALAGQPILCVAFNKRIADEMTKRLPSHCTAKTMNGLGHQAWANHVGERLTLDKDKIAGILKEIAADLRGEGRSRFWEAFSDIRKGVEIARMIGYIPKGAPDGHSLADADELRAAFDDAELHALAYEYVDEVLVTSIRRGFKGLIDFGDQVYLPVVYGAKFPTFPVTLVDEAQDLSPLNHEMIAKLVGRDRRLIAVGDSYQSIYGFRGAVSNGMNVLRERFAMREMTLSISFRCPISVVELARFRAPHMKYPEWAQPGEVRLNRELEWGPSILPQSAAIICRNNAPLFDLAIKLLIVGRNVKVHGSEISKRIVKVLEGLGPAETARPEAIRLVEAWARAKIDEEKLSLESIHDRSECMLVFVRGSKTLGEAIGQAKALFASEGPLELLSGHKSKGLEWDHVFHLDPDRCPSPWARSAEAYDQELNLKYVIITRAKATYTEVSLDHFNPEG